MKYSGVFPVGKLITPSGFSDTHSRNRSAVNRPRSGKLFTVINGIRAYVWVYDRDLKKDFSTNEVNTYFLPIIQSDKVTSQ